MLDLNFASHFLQVPSSEISFVMLATYAYRNVIKLEGSGRFPLDHWRIVIIRGTIPSIPGFHVTATGAEWETAPRRPRGGSKTMRRRQIGLRARNKLAQLSPNSRGSSANVARLPEELETLPFFPADAQNSQDEERKDVGEKEKQTERESWNCGKTTNVSRIFFSCWTRF